MPDKSNLPGGIAATLQVRSDLGVGGNTVVEGHHFRVAAEHRLVLPEHTLHATIEHHITPHQLKNIKKQDKIRYIIKVLEEIITSEHTLFLQGSGRIDTAEWMHYLDANKTAGEEDRQQLHKNAARNIEQVLAATPHKAPTIRPPASHHENYPS